MRKTKVSTLSTSCLSVTFSVAPLMVRLKNKTLKERKWVEASEIILLNL